MGLLSSPKSREKIARVIAKWCNKLCVLCYVIGVVWFLLLAYTQLNAHTYFSENALLPGLVDPNFRHSDIADNYYRELKDQVGQLKQLPLRSKMPVTWLVRKFGEIGLETHVQNYSFELPYSANRGKVYSGQNVYAILRAPKTAGTEALVLSAAFKAEPFAENTLPGIALSMALAHYFRENTYWAKDIILLVTDDSEIGMQAWLSAYHHTHNEYIYAGELGGRSGSIQAALNLELGTESVSRLDVRIEGLNGQLPNLDFVNTVVRLCKREGITPTLHKRADYWSPESLDGFLYSLKTMLLSMSQLATGCPSSNHGLFHRYNIEAVTLRGIKLKGTRAASGFAHIGRVVEGIYRSLNNLLERFHQSFFFYLLSAVERYISIGLYMPPFGLIALPIAIKALALWISAGSSLEANDTNAAQDDQTAANSKSAATTVASAADGKEDAAKPLLDKTSEQVNECPAQTKKKACEAAIAARQLQLAEAKMSLQRLLNYIPVLLVGMLFGIFALHGPRYFVATSVAWNVSSATALAAGLCAVQVAAIFSPLVVRWRLAVTSTDSSESSTRPSMNAVADVSVLKSLALLLLCVLLGATAIINISLAFYISVLAVPTALFVAPTNNRLVKFLESCVLIVVSPVGTVILSCVVYSVFAGKSTVSVASVWSSVESGMLHSAEQFQMLDNWTFGLVTLAYLPTWLFFWHLVWVKTVTA